MKMLRNRIYYSIKPFVPQSVRTGIRRQFALYQRKKTAAVWPIIPGSEKRPKGWLGWPGGKQFAVVLTHDVETRAGLQRCEDLMALEQEIGFRSSYNFVPEGEYKVPKELRDKLRSNGFEVGVHDLKHDGRLYRSRREFNNRAVRINHYLREWQADGFRSAFMLNELDWLHELNICYDASTFDTDPFEPQPQGQETIFPFWVDRPALRKSQRHSFSAHSTCEMHYPDSGSVRPGYIELPYTLPQDSTLFVLLKEKTPEIWLKKLDWLAQNGGMALVITHPDYMSFNGSSSRTDYPVALYREFLEHVRDKYAGAYWPALPKEVAAYVKQKQIATDIVRPSHVESGVILNGLNDSDAIQAHDREIHSAKAVRLAGRVVMLVENYFPQDTRVRNEALLLKSAGCNVSVVCYRKPDQPYHENVDGISVHRIARFELFRKTPSGERSHLSRFWLRFRSLVGYLIEYVYFTIACFIYCARIFIKSGFDVIHAHNPPDTLFLVALPFKLLGKKFVFDHHDLCPELYQSRYSAERGVYARVLQALEWCSLRTADVAIATNESYKQIEVERGGVRPDRIFVVRNGPSRERMKPRSPSERLRRLNKTILCYVGSLNPQDGVDYLLRALNHLKNDLCRNDFYCLIIGDGDSLSDLRHLACELGLNECVELTGFIPDEELLADLAAADICVDPDPASPLNNVSTWIKIMEYMAQSKPIVSFDLKETRFSAQEAAIFVPPNDELAFARAIMLLMDDPELRTKLGTRGRERVEDDLQWSVTGQNLLAAYQTLLTGSNNYDQVDSHASVFQTKD